jgi:hypothetical protein
MEFIFTKEEMANGLIIEGNSTSKRTPLDLDKYNVIKSCIYFYFYFFLNFFILI